MRWNKQGVIFKPESSFPWMASHASLPVVEAAGEGRLRIYFSPRDSEGRSHAAYLEVDESDPGQLLYLHDKPILMLGEPGTFDDNGIMPSWIVNDGGTKYLYYMGWNRQVTVPYRVAIGLAISTDGGKTFEKYSRGPICDRDANEPFFNSAPCVLKEGDRWKMWYLSCTGWRMINNKQEPLYNIKYAESSNGIDWSRTGRVCIGYDEFTDAITRPCVYFDAGKYRMLYSYRSATDYRTDPAKSYRLGYAESVDGLEWHRLDGEVGIERSADGWDSQMIEYCFRYCENDKTYLFYNGNGFGQSGMGYAVLEP